MTIIQRANDEELPLEGTNIPSRVGPTSSVLPETPGRFFGKEFTNRGVHQLYTFGNDIQNKVKKMFRNGMHSERHTAERKRRMTI